MNKTEKNVVINAAKTGFTFAGDSIFSSFIQAKRALNSLVRQGYLAKKEDKEGRIEYIPTEQAFDYIKYGIEV